MLGDKIVREIPDGYCDDCGTKGHTVLHTYDGLVVTECSHCGREIDCEELEDETDYDAMAKDDKLFREDNCE